MSLDLFVAYREAYERASIHAHTHHEAMRAHRQMDALALYPIRENLVRLGVSDMTCEGIVDSILDWELARCTRSVSEICALRPTGLLNLMGVDSTAALPIVRIMRDNAMVGSVDGSGCFCYSGAPDLRTALAWGLATDGGRHCLFEKVDTDAVAAHAQGINDVIVREGTAKSTFDGSYLAVLREIFVHKRTSRFEEPDWELRRTLWRVATRTLGREHYGYRP